MNVIKIIILVLCCFFVVPSYAQDNAQILDENFIQYIIDSTEQSSVF